MRGYNKRERHIRNAVLTAELLCLHCSGRGEGTLADMVDHILFLAEGNHRIGNQQPLCSRCHAIKTAAVRTAKG